jgi:catechol 2,3-dioxygenase-like lactoylglutathione lyase family enzyme
MPPRMSLSALVLDAPDARELAGFYERLLGWPRTYDEPGWVMLKNPDGGPGLSFAHEPAYQRPRWPTQPPDQQMMTHLDIRVDDLEQACEHAAAVGAELADFQPQQHVRVFFDPAGHPFCLFEA